MNPSVAVLERYDDLWHCFREYFLDLTDVPDRHAGRCGDLLADIAPLSFRQFCRTFTLTTGLLICPGGLSEVRLMFQAEQDSAEIIQPARPAMKLDKTSQGFVLGEVVLDAEKAGAAL